MDYLQNFGYLPKALDDSQVENLHICKKKVISHIFEPLASLYKFCMFFRASLSVVAGGLMLKLTAFSALSIVSVKKLCKVGGGWGITLLIKIWDIAKKICKM